MINFQEVPSLFTIRGLSRCFSTAKAPVPLCIGMMGGEVVGLQRGILKEHRVLGVLLGHGLHPHLKPESRAVALLALAAGTVAVVKTKKDN